MTIAGPAIFYDAVLFDLDGTLVDPAGGITGGIAHALRAMDLPVPADEALHAMIGPKLADAMVGHAGVPAHRVAEAIGIYRSWYRDTGKGRSRLYPGISELLAGLRDAGIPLGVATQKPEPLAKTLLAHHGVAGLFDVICGSSADETLMPGDAGYRQGKSEIIGSALAALGVSAARGGAAGAVMVGDRHQDVHGAAANSIPCIGVSWGFAPDGELAAAGAAGVVHTAAELARELAGPAGGAFRSAVVDGGARGAL
ncbi:HAD hydrolase-like protein [Specibacter sp. RAF43]|uniref:HAD hydrolase-like protein n=1 Tax=Specibacter sp. RAF43 TaxID=3233057 RepID=UPI003F9C6164